MENWLHMQGQEVHLSTVALIQQIQEHPIPLVIVTFPKPLLDSFHSILENLPINTFPTGVLR
jgi:hypothetical protein